MKQEIFSRTEKKILKVLGRRKLTIGDITKAVYHRPRPLNGRTMIATAARSINKKCRRKKLPWYLNGTGVGRQEKTLWRDKR